MTSQSLLGTTFVIACLCLASAAHGAKVEPIDDIQALPANNEEEGIWALASTHENRIGNEGRIYRNREIEAYLESMVNKMIGSRLDHLGISIDFILVKEATLNAWVYPYGTIAVHTGLLAGMDNEAQLASILGHEISHFLQRHSYRELIVDKKQSIIGKGLGLLATVAAAKYTGTIDPSLMNVGGFWTELVTSGYSRKLEYVADAEGLQLMANANYSRDQAVIGFQTLGENDVYGVVNVAALWSSHPKLENRIENIQKSIKKESKQKDFKPGVDPSSPDASPGHACDLCSWSNWAHR